MKKLFLIGLIVLATVASFFSVHFTHTKDQDVFRANVEALAEDENPEPCTSPKTWLGLGHCANITSVICKDDTGDCN